LAILNYTTEISVEKTAAEIQTKLVKARAKAVLCEYSPEGVLTGIAFQIDTQHGLLAFKLPANIDGVFNAMRQDKKLQPRYKKKAQAARIAWRIIKDWVEAQLAIIEAGVATLPQVFLPYAQTGDGRTVYERFEKQGLQALTYGGGDA
jgi:hypothetical protein